MIRRLLTTALFAFADRYLRPVQAYLYCPAEWLDAADDVDLDELWPAERAPSERSPSVPAIE